MSAKVFSAGSLNIERLSLLGLHLTVYPDQILFDYRNIIVFLVTTYFPAGKLQQMFTRKRHNLIVSTKFPLALSWEKS